MTEVRPDWEGFCRDLLDNWPVSDVDGSELFDLALKHGMIREVPGGFNPYHHLDTENTFPEPGDPWYEYTFPYKRKRNFGGAVD